jgi:hypothetical protein
VNFACIKGNSSSIIMLAMSLNLAPKSNFEKFLKFCLQVVCERALGGEKVNIVVLVLCIKLTVLWNSFPAYSPMCVVLYQVYYTSSRLCQCLRARLVSSMYLSLFI